MFAVFRAITTLQCIAQKLLHKTEITDYLQIYSQITAIQISQQSQKDRAAGGLVIYCQKWKTITERHYFTDIIGLSSTTVT